MKNDKLNDCPIDATIKAISGKWKALILWQIKDGPKRFSTLIDEGKGISPKVLTQQLRELQSLGVVSRAVFPTVPPRVEYCLTERGQTLVPIIQSMVVWGTELLSGSTGAAA